MISKLGKVFTTPLAKQTAQKAKAYLKTSEYLAQGNKLAKSPVADTFVRSAKKQNAHIIGDVVDQYGNRWITKRLPSGTTVTKHFWNNGEYKGKEVIAKKGRGVHRIQSGDRHLTYFSGDNGSILQIAEPFDGAPTREVYKSIVGQEIPYWLSEFRGMTTKVNEGNELYRQLKNAGMVY